MTRVTRSSQRFTNIEMNTTNEKMLNRRRQRKISPSSIAENSTDDDSHANNVNVTPPKLRKSCVKENNHSPSSLLKRLSLIEQNGNSDCASEANQPSKIDNARKVLNAGETEDLYGRENEIEELTKFLTINSKNKTSASIYISGQPGKYVNLSFLFSFFKILK